MRQRNLQKKKDLVTSFEKVFKIAKQMKAENCSVNGDKCIKTDKGELALTDAEKNLA